MSETDDEYESRNEAEEAKIDAMTYDELRQYHETATEKNRNDGKYSWKHICQLLTDLKTGNQSINVSERRSKLARLLTIEEWREMGEDINEWVKLDGLELSNCGLTDEKLEALFGGLDTNDCDCPFEYLDLSNNPFSAAGIEAILTFLKERTVKPNIQLNKTNLGSEGMRLLSEVKIDTLALVNSQIGGDLGLRHILTSRNSNVLTALELKGVRFGRQGFEIVSSFLMRDDISLKKLFIDCNRGPGEYAKMIARALLSNKSSKLELILLRSSSERSDPLKDIYRYVYKIMCDTTTFETLCQSNHHLQWKNPHWILPDNAPWFHSLLAMNGRREHGATLSQILRSKLRRFYFNGNFDLQPFYKIEVNLMPHLLQLVTRKEEAPGVRNIDLHHDVCDGDLGGIFRILRNINVPDTFEQPKLIEMKKAEVDMLKANNTSLKADTATLKAENESLQTENASMKDMLEKLTKEIEELRCCKKHSKRVKTK